MFAVEVVNNMFTQLKEEILPVCQCPETSAIIELVIPYTSCANVRLLLKAFSQDWIQFCTDKCSSHIVQKTVMSIPGFIKDKLKGFNFEGPFDESDETYLIQSVLGISEFFLVNLEDVLTHMHASHILRALFQVLGGTSAAEGENMQKSRRSRDYGKKFRQQDGKRNFLIQCNL